jgi:hypothetical protein
MKRLVGIQLGLVLLAATALPAQGQGRKLHLAAVGGVNFAKWTGSDVGSGAERRTGFHAGGQVGVDLSEAFSIQSGLIYSQEGTGASGGGLNLAVEVDYLEVPLELKAGITLRGYDPDPALSSRRGGHRIQDPVQGGGFERRCERGSRLR